MSADNTNSNTINIIINIIAAAKIPARALRVTFVRSIMITLLLLLSTFFEAKM